jgi:3-oxoacyl-[acyl-carrier protein] reductase
MRVLLQQNSEGISRRLILGVAKAEKTAQHIISDGGDAIAVAGDITNSEALSDLVEKSAEFGGGKIHIIINNAGYAWDDPIEKIQDKQWGEPSLGLTASYILL